jgi:hypothetical protein
MSINIEDITDEMLFNIAYKHKKYDIKYFVNLYKRLESFNEYNKRLYNVIDFDFNHYLNFIFKEIKLDQTIVNSYIILVKMLDIIYYITNPDNITSDNYFIYIKKAIYYIYKYIFEKYINMLLIESQKYNTDKINILLDTLQINTINPLFVQLFFRELLEQTVNTLLEISQTISLGLRREVQLLKLNNLYNLYEWMFLNGLFFYNYIILEKGIERQPILDCNIILNKTIYLNNNMFIDILSTKINNNILNIKTFITYSYIRDAWISSVIRTIFFKYKFT